MKPETEPRGMPPVTGVVLALNTLIFLALAVREGDIDISARTMIDYGGLIPAERIGAQYWRLVSYGFLHFSLMHLVVNAICLIAWGVPLERLFGSLRLALLYLGSVVIAGAGSILLHQQPFVSAGASGGVSGLLGALFLLFLLRRIEMPAAFFVINIGLNIAIALFAPGIDWQAHLAGFLGGMALVMLLMPPFWRRRS